MAGFLFLKFCEGHKFKDLRTLAISKQETNKKRTIPR